MSTRSTLCEAVGDHKKCPGMETLRVDHLELGTVMCDCACHKRPDAEVIAFPTTGDR
jgi:hypothetical protein